MSSNHWGYMSSMLAVDCIRKALDKHSVIKLKDLHSHINNSSLPSHVKIDLKGQDNQRAFLLKYDNIFYIDVCDEITLRMGSDDILAIECIKNALEKYSVIKLENLHSHINSSNLPSHVRTDLKGRDNQRAFIVKYDNIFCIDDSNSITLCVDFDQSSEQSSENTSNYSPSDATEDHSEVMSDCTTSTSVEDLVNWEHEAVEFIVKRLAKHGHILLQNLPGHFAQAPDNVKAHLTKHTELQTFLDEYDDLFEIDEDDDVIICNTSIKEYIGTLDKADIGSIAISHLVDAIRENVNINDVFGFIIGTSTNGIFMKSYHNNHLHTIYAPHEIVTAGTKVEKHQTVQLSAAFKIGFNKYNATIVAPIQKYLYPIKQKRGWKGVVVFSKAIYCIILDLTDGSTALYTKNSSNTSKLDVGTLVLYNGTEYTEPGNDCTTYVAFDIKSCQSEEECSSSDSNTWEFHAMKCITQALQKHTMIKLSNLHGHVSNSLPDLMKSHLKGQDKQLDFLLKHPHVFHVSGSYVQLVEHVGSSLSEASSYSSAEERCNSSVQNISCNPDGSKTVISSDIRGIARVDKQYPNGRVHLKDAISGVTLIHVDKAHTLEKDCYVHYFARHNRNAEIYKYKTIEIKQLIESEADAIIMLFENLKNRKSMPLKMLSLSLTMMDMQENIQQFLLPQEQLKYFLYKWSSLFNIDHNNVVTLNSRLLLAKANCDTILIGSDFEEGHCSDQSDSHKAVESQNIVLLDGNVRQPIELKWEYDAMQFIHKRFLKRENKIGLENLHGHFNQAEEDVYLKIIKEKKLPELLEKYPSIFMITTEGDTEIVSMANIQNSAEGTSSPLSVVSLGSVNSSSNSTSLISESDLSRQLSSLSLQNSGLETHGGQISSNNLPFGLVKNDVQKSEPLANVDCSFTKAKTDLVKGSNKLKPTSITGIGYVAAILPNCLIIHMDKGDVGICDVTTDQTAVCVLNDTVKYTAVSSVNQTMKWCITQIEVQSGKRQVESIKEMKDTEVQTNLTGHVLATRYYNQEGNSVLKTSNV